MAEASPVVRHIALAAWYAMPLLLAASRAGADVALCIIGVMFLVHCLLNKKWEWTKQPEVRLLALLWLWMSLVSGLAAVDAPSAFAAGAIWGRFVIFYAAARYWLLNPSVLKTGNNITLFILAFVAVDAAWQYITGVSLSGYPILGDRLGATINKPVVGIFLLKIGLPMAGIVLYRLISQGGNKRRVMAVLASMFAIIAVITISGERSTALLMLLAAGVAGLLFFWFQPESRRKVLLAEALIVALVCVLEMSLHSVQQRTHFLGQQLTDFWHTAYGQLYIAAGKLWMQHPLAGIGAQQFWDICRAHMQEMQVTYCDVHPHNMYMEWLVAGGSIGFILFLSAMGMIVRQLLRSISFRGPAAILAIFACAEMAVILFPLIVTQSQFSNWPAISFWYSLILAMSMPMMAQTEERPDGR